LSDRKLKSLPPDPFRHQNLAIAGYSAVLVLAVFGMGEVVVLAQSN
jgi:hypothetical protein